MKLAVAAASIVCAAVKGCEVPLSSQCDGYNDCKDLNDQLEILKATKKNPDQKVLIKPLENLLARLQWKQAQEPIDRMHERYVKMVHSGIQELITPFKVLARFSEKVLAVSSV